MKPIDIESSAGLHPNPDIGQCVGPEHDSHAHVALGVLLDAHGQIDAAGEHY